jgi:hypothetical protein
MHTVGTEISRALGVSAELLLAQYADTSVKRIVHMLSFE